MDYIYFIKFIKRKKLKLLNRGLYIYEFYEFNQKKKKRFYEQ